MYESLDGHERFQNQLTADSSIAVQNQLMTTTRGVAPAFGKATATPLILENHSAGFSFSALCLKERRLIVACEKYAGTQKERPDHTKNRTHGKRLVTAHEQVDRQRND